jgi:tRNA-dihydrouridine synthase
VAKVKQSMPNFPIISNGNVITYEDVLSNRENTQSDGIMSAEGILNNPALYLPRLGDVGSDKVITIQIPSPLHRVNTQQNITNGFSDKLIRKLKKKLRKIESIEKKQSNGSSLDEEQKKLLGTKSSVLAEIKMLEGSKSDQTHDSIPVVAAAQSTTMKLSDLVDTANDKVSLAKEYLSLVRRYPMKIRSVVFHTRRMCKDLFEKYQLMEECIACTSIDAVEEVLIKCEGYVRQPHTFLYNQDKARKEKEALDRKHREEGKRKAYEARMIRKAKREGLADREHYLRIGAEVPSRKIISKLKLVSKEEALAIWKTNHSQHCMSYHLDEGGCKRDRACAFLHSDAKDENTFDEVDEVAG